MNRHNYYINNSLFLTLENLENYIWKEGYYSDWTSRRQFYQRTLPPHDYKVNAKIAENGFFSIFSVACLLFFDNEEYGKNVRQEAQKEFYKWIDATKIKADNCPEKLKHYLNEINEAIISGKSKLYLAYEKLRKKEKFTEFDLGSPSYIQASLEVDKEFGYPVGSCCSPDELRNNEPKNYEVKIESNAEAGEKIFQQIKNSITDEYKWDFSFREKYFKTLKARIKELEAKKGQLPSIQPKED
ncbi:MAG: hypothetical protein I3275_07375, partial [Candidatus Moeniiplasma glomeromycotorum]|nr:hypothetical protein [Candidatus Moeniiplasma glomeromycotorum]